MCYWKRLLVCPSVSNHNWRLPQQTNQRSKACWLTSPLKMPPFQPLQRSFPSTFHRATSNSTKSLLSHPSTSVSCAPSAVIPSIQVQIQPSEPNHFSISRFYIFQGSYVLFLSSLFPIGIHSPIPCQSPMLSRSQIQVSSPNFTIFPFDSSTTSLLLLWCSNSSFASRY